jgi:uncharacterized membrane protein
MNGRTIARWLLAALYLAAGVLHLAIPAVFAKIMPPGVPQPILVVQATGACELAGAIGLTTRRFRRAAGVGLALYAVCVFPANVQHAVTDLGSGRGLGWWYHVPRLFAQPFIVMWALWVGEVWPFSRPR